MTQLYSPGVVLKNTAEAVLVPLKGGISTLNEVYQALIKADVDPVTGQCSNYDYIRQKIVQVHQLLERSEQTASSGLKSLEKNLERLTQDEGKLESEINHTKNTLENLRTEQASSEKLLRDSQGALELARTNLTSTKQTHQNQESRKSVGAGLMLIPVVGWIPGLPMVIGGAIEISQSEHAVRVAEEEVRKSDTEVKKYQCKVSEYKSKISQTSHDISEKDDKLKQTHDRIQKLKKLVESLAEFQEKMRSAVHLLCVLSGRVSVAEHQTRRFILQESVMKVMEDVMKATEKITGNELLYNNDMPRLLDQLKENSQRLADICALEENSTKNKTT